MRLEKNTAYINILVCNVTIMNRSPVAQNVQSKSADFALFKLGEPMTVCLVIQSNFILDLSGLPKALEKPRFCMCRLVLG